jgi:hypothetical protein
MTRAFSTQLASTVILAISLFSAETSSAQSADALVNKLLQKGILTAQEAEDLKKDANDNFSTAFKIKTGMPEWVDSLKFGGDLRMRYDMIRPDSEMISNRDRARFRLRFGAVAVLQDDFEVGFRVASTTGTGGDEEGDPISTNETFHNNGSRKPIGIDLAYVKWSPLEIDGLDDAFTIGKMNNPFSFSEMVFDGDYTPEGLAQDFSLKLNEQHELDFGLGEFILDELSSSGRDPWMFIGELRLGSEWTEHISSVLGLGTLHIVHPESLVNSAVPNIGRGNTRDASTALVHDFNVLIVDGGVTYQLESFPLYSGHFPITLGGEYIHNFGASGDNYAFGFGPTFGKSGKKGHWEISYKYKYLGADAIYEELVDSDNAGYYHAAPPGESPSRFPGVFSGTNIRGHVIRMSYTPFDSLTLYGAIWVNELIEEFPPDSEDSGVRFIFDAVWKF